eukprot:9502664-Pyramimonas_sp.AAC.1
MYILLMLDVYSRADPTGGDAPSRQLGDAPSRQDNRQRSSSKQQVHSAQRRLVVPSVALDRS